MQERATESRAGLADMAVADMITVGIVEDNNGLRRHLKSLFDGTPGFRCSAALASGEEAIEAIPKSPPDVLLMDINLPGMSGIACTAHLKGRLPSLQIVMITVYDDPETVFRALKAGACGYLLKRSTPREILRAVSDVHAGGAPMTGEIARMVVSTFQAPPVEPAGPSTAVGLSAREREILDLLAGGLSNKEIADRLGLSVETVRSYLKNTYEKLHVRCRTEAVVKYLRSMP